VLDVNALAKGWIIEEASIILRLHGARYLVNAGGDVTASSRSDGTPWRIGVQHPEDRASVLGVFEVFRGAVATSGSYERGQHIRSGDHAALTSVTVVGPDLGEADGLSTAVFASGQSPPEWWHDVDPSYGLLTLSADNRLRWLPPTAGGDIEWQFPNQASVRQESGGRDSD
jgi:thiamine biosynthesis lipoprotein